MVRKALYSAAVTGVAGLLLLVSAPMPQAHAEMTALDELTAFPEPTTALSESIDVCLGSGEQVACIERLAGSPEGRGQAGSIAAYIGRRINEDEAADFAAAIARGAGDPDEANAAFMALASAFPRRAGEIAAAVIAAAPGTGPIVAASLEQVLLAAAQGSIVLGAIADNNPNTNRVVEANRPFLVKSQGGPDGNAFTTRLDTERDTPVTPTTTTPATTDLGFN